jgi:hypothetical protein
MMNNTAYGIQVRAREAFNRAVARMILGNDKQIHNMNIQRKSALGVGQWANITRPMTAAKLMYIRQRLKRATREALQRELIGGNPFAIIRKRIQ